MEWLGISWTQWIEYPDLFSMLTSWKQWSHLLQSVHCYLCSWTAHTMAMIKHVQWSPGFVPLSLLSMHSFTGHDFVSSFGRKGKGVTLSLHLGGKAGVWHCLFIWEERQGCDTVSLFERKGRGVTLLLHLGGKARRPHGFLVPSVADF